MSEPQIGTIFNHRYLIKGKLGQGGMGVVFEAEDIKEDHRPCALKIIRAQHATSDRHQKRFDFERSLLTRLQHKNIVEVYEADQLSDPLADQQQIIVMELLKGESLKERLSRDPTMTVQEGIELICQALDALEWAHHEGIVHRDLKPDNLFLCQSDNGQPILKILDFGVAKDLESDIALTMSVENAMIGTPLYMSPEQVKNVGLSPSSDLYAVGVLLYQLIRGHAVFSQPELYVSDQLKMLPKNMQVIWLQLNVKAPALSYEQDLDRIVEQLLEKEPEDRVYTAKTLNQALKGWLESHSNYADRIIPDELMKAQKKEIDIQSMKFDPSTLAGFADLDDLFSTYPPHKIQPRSVLNQREDRTDKSLESEESTTPPSISITQPINSQNSARMGSARIKSERRSQTKQLIGYTLVALFSVFCAVFVFIPQDFIQPTQNNSSNITPSHSEVIENSWRLMQSHLNAKANEALLNPKRAVAPKPGVLTSVLYQSLKPALSKANPNNISTQLKFSILELWMFNSYSSEESSAEDMLQVKKHNYKFDLNSLESDLELYMYGVLKLNFHDEKQRKINFRDGFRAFRLADNQLLKSKQRSEMSNKAFLVRIAYYLSEKRYKYIKSLFDRIERNDMLKTFFLKDLKDLRTKL